MTTATTRFTYRDGSIVATGETREQAEALIASVNDRRKHATRAAILRIAEATAEHGTGQRRRDAERHLEELRTMERSS